ncbi:MAG TPA: TetR family transcriptional regulator [Xanthobacteraceae bacterium]|nr:TetR family transcriptional regulator [Xanthobacteraceae bacterium]
MARNTKSAAKETRRRILDAAERLFFANGVAQTSLEQIAEEAGVTRGAIYWHFADRVALFRAMLEDVRLPQEDMVEQAAACGNPDPLGLLERVACDSLATLAADEQRQRVYAILLFRCEYLGEMADVLQRQQDADTAMQANLARIFTMARDDGALVPQWSPDVAARVFALMMRGLWVDWLRYGRSFDLVAHGAACVEQLFRSFRRAEPAAAPVEAG